MTKHCKSSNAAVRMQTLTKEDQQAVATLLVRSLPSGYLCSEMIHIDGKPHEVAHQIEIALQYNLLEPCNLRAGPTSKKHINRYRITKAGLYLVGKVLPEYAFLWDYSCGILGRVSVLFSSRGSQNVAAAARTSAKGDCQCALVCHGVDTIVTALAKGYDPFIFGCPDRSIITKPCVNDMLIDACVQYTYNAILDPYTHGRLYLSHDEMPPLFDHSGNRLRVNSDCRGVLIDLDHREVYLVFRWHDHNTVSTLTSAHVELMSQLQRRLENAKLHSATHPVRFHALVLCDSHTQLQRQAKLFPKFRAPADVSRDHVLVDYAIIADVSQDSDDIPGLRSIIGMGPLAHYNAQYQVARSHIPTEGGIFAPIRMFLSAPLNMSDLCKIAHGTSWDKCGYRQIYGPSRYNSIFRSCLHRYRRNCLSLARHARVPALAKARIKDRLPLAKITACVFPLDLPLTPPDKDIRRYQDEHPCM